MKREIKIEKLFSTFKPNKSWSKAIKNCTFKMFSFVLKNKIDCSKGETLFSIHFSILFIIFSLTTLYFSVFFLLPLLFYSFLTFVAFCFSISTMLFSLSHFSLLSLFSPSWNAFPNRLDSTNCFGGNGFLAPKKNLFSRKPKSVCA